MSNSEPDPEDLESIWEDDAGIIRFPDSACALVISDAGEVLLVQQDRPAGRSLELPGGKVESLESPEEAACRELAEETGVDSGSSRGLITLDLDLSVSIHRTHLVLVRPAVTPTVLPAVARWISLGEAVADIMQGAITHAPTVAGILYLASGLPR